ncbi:hypothetical protein Taro_021199 [Colocasia esculenta]|uniref:BED-type domain-containing protein n=1 Tax=Colocasia esculenta TaxID=4460 RepID=A0A843UYC4_COLES|nr:hypothetical protein [Colocasia esculenta]
MAAEGGAAPAPHSSSNPPSADPAWAHGIVVDMARRKVQCKYCNRVLSGGIFRLKQHLVGIKEQFRRASQASRRSFAEEDYLRRTGHDLGEGSGHGGSGQGSSSAGKSTNIPEVPVDISRDGDPRVGPLDPFLTRRREKQPSISAAFKNLKIYKEKIGRATSRWTDGRNENYDNTSEVLIGAKNIIKRILDNEDRAIIACKQMHDYRLQLYHFGTSTAQRAAQILSPGELDDVSLLPEFETPQPLNAKRRQWVQEEGARNMALALQTWRQ